MGLILFTPMGLWIQVGHVITDDIIEGIVRHLKKMYE